MKHGCICVCVRCGYACGGCVCGVDVDEHVWCVCVCGVDMTVWCLCVWCVCVCT